MIENGLNSCLKWLSNYLKNSPEHDKIGRGFETLQNDCKTDDVNRLESPVVSQRLRRVPKISKKGISKALKQGYL